MHHKAKIEFKYVQLARQLYDQGANPKEISDYIGVSINTLWDWLQFKTRING